jgi:uncharacterized protein YuzE
MLPAEMTYDPEADALYICLAEGVIPVEAAEVSHGVVLDLADDGRIVGVEIMPASLTLAPGAWRSAPLPTLKTKVIAAE